MLQSMGLQRVRYDSVTEQQKGLKAGMLIFLPLPRLQRRWLSSFNAPNQPPCSAYCSQQLLMKVPPTEEDGVQTPEEVRWKCQLEETEREPWSRALMPFREKKQHDITTGLPWWLRQ